MVFSEMLWLVGVCLAGNVHICGRWILDRDKLCAIRWWRMTEVHVLCVYYVTVVFRVNSWQQTIDCFTEIWECAEFFIPRNGCNVGKFETRWIALGVRSTRSQIFGTTYIQFNQLVIIILNDSTQESVWKQYNANTSRMAYNFIR